MHFKPVAEAPLAALRTLIEREPNRAAGCAAAHGGRRVRLSRLRHGAAHGGYAGSARRRSDRHPGRDPRAPDLGDRVRCRRRHDHRRYSGAAAKVGHARKRRSRARVERLSARSSLRSTGRSTNPRPRLDRRPARRRAALEHHARGIQAHGGARQGVHRRRRYFSGRAVAALRSAVSRCRRSRSIARCAGSIRRLICFFSISATSPSPDRARRSWSKPTTAS